MMLAVDQHDIILPVLVSTGLGGGIVCRTLELTEKELVVISHIVRYAKVPFLTIPIIVINHTYSSL